MPTIIEAITAVALVGGLAAGGAALAGTTQPADSSLATLAGVSQPVYDCATTALAGKTADQVQQLIDDIVNKRSNPDADALTACVQADPFGWAGTDQEWALQLLKGNN